MNEPREVLLHHGGHALRACDPVTLPVVHDRFDRHPTICAPLAQFVCIDDRYATVKLSTPIKVLHHDLGGALGADRILAEIKTTTDLRHRPALPSFDLGAADILPCFSRSSHARRISPRTSGRSPIPSQFAPNRSLTVRETV